MYKGNYIISIIPARGGSKGVPRKNLRELCGKPLIAHSIMRSLCSQYIDKTVVSTEDPEIADISTKYGAEVILRPQELAKDTTPTEPVMVDVLVQLAKDGVFPNYVVLLQPTSPVRLPADIDQAIRQLIDAKGDSLLSVRENSSFFWSKENKPLNYDCKKRPRRQDKQWELIENGSIYITKREILLNEKNRIGGRILTYLMPEWASFEIDTQFDFELIEFMARKHLPSLFNGVEKIKLTIFDVDGVFTDGSVYLNESGQEMLKFSRVDGKGIELLQQAGVDIAVITSEETAIVRERMKKLKINHIYTGVKDKKQIYDFLKKELNLADKAIAYCGDDIGDLLPIKNAGFTACPNNAVDAIKRECMYVSSHTGGSGFVREICEIIIESMVR